MTGRRTTLAVALSLGLCGLSACTELHDVQGQARAYNFAADEVNNQLLLLNILRAAFNRPAQWTSTRTILGQVALSGQLGLAAPLGHRGPAVPLLLATQGTAGTQSQSTIDVLDTQEYYHAYLTEIPVETIAFYEHGELDAFLDYLFFGDIIVAAGEQRFVAQNNPGSPIARAEFDQAEFRPSWHEEFEPVLWAFFDAQLVPERYKEKTMIGPPLSVPQMMQNLKEIITATTTKDAGISLDKAEKTGQYQLQRSDEANRYCFRGQSQEPKEKQFGNAVPKNLGAVALGLRCGATPDERHNMDTLLRELKVKPVIAADSLTVLNTEEECARTDLTEYLTRYCKFVKDIKRIAGIVVPDGSAISIKILTRSTNDVVEYLGRVASFSWQDRPIFVPEYRVDDPRARGLDKRRTILCGCEEQYNRGCKERNYAQREEERARFICYKLLVVNKNDPRGREFVSVAYDGDTYWVPGDEQGNSFAVFETVHQLLALAKVAKDLPPTAILSVSPIP